MANKKKGFDFEQAMAELEHLVGDLETGKLSLEDSLKTFEQGVKLTRECQQALQDAEQKVELLLQKGGQLEAQPFADTSEADA
jgi:exodeoxyribonuclease VII small subunit